ncbi:MAG: hypothetical protein LWX07_03125 [Bacteroidetes bacterium]|nr:hypothetical protein [Bacteroidota bacterium]
MGEDYSNLQKMYQQRFQTQYQNMQESKQPPSYRPKNNSGCGLIAALAAGFFVALGVALVLFFSQGSFDVIKEKFSETNSRDDKQQPVKKVSKKKKPEGTITNAVIIPGKDGQQKLWLQSWELDGTEYRLNTYIYDPFEKEMQGYTGVTSPNYPPSYSMLYANDEIWKVNSESGPNKAGIYTYDPVTGSEKLSTESFCAKFPELNGGITRLYYFPNPPRLNLESADGRKPVYDILGGELYAGDTEFRNSFKDKKNTITVFALGVENSGESARKRLFLVTGPESSLWSRSVEEYYFTSSSTLKFMLNSEAKVTAKGKVFLEGVMLYQDDDACFILHQDKTGTSAERLLSCVDRSGTVLWTKATGDGLSKRLRATDDNSLSSMFFIKNAVQLSRSGNLVLFNYEKSGFTGFDFSTGKVLFGVETGDN